MVPKSGNRFSDKVMRNQASRRMFLHLLAGAPLLAAGFRADAREASVIPRLIREARAHASVSQRVDFISRALLGVRYQSYTLIGGPRQKEVFVMRDDAFDCVTYCEAVLAAAIANDFLEYGEILRRIRYEHGAVRWAERNHDFAQWSRRIVENNICKPFGIGPSVMVDKSLSGSDLGKRRYAIAAITPPTFLANQKALQGGDVIGFVSRQSNLDFFHTGFVAFDKRGALLLRHASQSHGRVVDEDMKGFIAANGVKWVTLLRAQEPAAG
jgi:hypothetical protein